jgi:hypothetical protein
MSDHHAPTGSKTIDAFLKTKHGAKVAAVWNEGDDGWWAELKPGFWCISSDTQGCHEYTVAELIQAIRGAGS